MRIEELLEEQQLDELSLSGIGKGLGKAAGAVGGAVGGVQGAWQGMKNAYGQKRDRVAAVSQRNVQRAGGYRTNKATVTNPAVPGSGNTQDTTQTPTNTATTSASSNQPARTSVPTTKTADEIAKILSDLYSNQSNPLGVPKVKQEIVALAKHAGVTTIQESGKFTSKFLGMDI